MSKEREIIAFLISLVLLANIVNFKSFLGAVFLFAVGISFIVSKKARARLYYFKVLYWVSENMVFPRTRFNYVLFVAGITR